MTTTQYILLATLNNLRLHVCDRILFVSARFSKLRRRASVNNFFLFPIRGVGEHSDKYIVVLANYSAQNDTCNFTGLDHFRTFGM